MRTLQRLSHVQPPRLEKLQRIEAEERRTSRVRELWAWWRLIGTCAVLGMVGAVVMWGMAITHIEDGLVHAPLVTVEAPADVRVVEVLCEAGQEVLRGDPLLRLESLNSDHERRALVLEVEQCRLRLELVEAGGEVGDFLSRRGELVAEASREEQLAQEQLDVALAEVERLERERAALALELEQSRRESVARAASLGAQLEGVQAHAEGLRAEHDLAQFDEERGRRLTQQGIAAERTQVETAAARRSSAKEVEEYDASARSLEVEVTAAERLAELETQHVQAALGAKDAAIAAARQRAEEAEVRAGLWHETGARRKGMAPDGAVDTAQLRALELRLRRSELGEAEARVADFDARAGNLLICAESSGVIEWLDVEAGAVVNAGTELARYVDTESLRVVVYATPEAAAALEPGDPCRLVLHGSNEVVMGHVATIGASWVPCPRALPRRTEAYEELRVRVHVELDDEDVEGLRPNMRVKARFPQHDEEGS